MIRANLELSYSNGVKDFTSCDFQSQDLTGLFFEGCNFKSANFSNCNLINTVFEDCDLSSTNFSNSILDNAIFINCDVDGDTTFSNAQCIDVDAEEWMVDWLITTGAVFE